MAEYDGPEGIIEEQLEQQHQSIREMQNSIDSFRTETSRHFDEIMRKSDLIMDMLRGMSNDIRLSSPSKNGSEFSIMNLQPDSNNGDVASCDEGSEIEVQQVETFISTTPIAGISAASTYTTRFEETTDDIAVDGKKNLIESEVCSVFDELTESSPAVLLKGPVLEPCARYLFDETPKLFLVDSDGGVYEKISSSKIEVLEIGHHLIDEMPELTSAEQNKRVDAHEEMILPIVGFQRDLSYGSEVTKVSSFNFSSKFNLEEEFMFVDLKNHELDVEIWVGEVIVFDPGGSFWLHNGCDSFEFFDDKQHFDKFSGNEASSVLALKNVLPITMVEAVELLKVGCGLFDPGRGYLSPTVSHATLRDKYARKDESSMPKNMCVCIVECGSNEACKSLMQLHVDYLSWIQGALDSDDVELVQMKFFIVPNTIQPGVVPKLVDVSSDSVINADVINLPTHQDDRTFGNFYVVADKIVLLTGEAYIMEIVGNKLSKLSPICVKSSVGKTFNQFMLYMSWLSLIVVKTGNELATEMVMLNGVEWNLLTEQGWSA